MLFRRGQNNAPSRGDLPLQKSAYVKVFKVRDEAFRCRFPLLHECIGDAEVHRVVDDLVVLGVGDAPVQFFILPAGTGISAPLWSPPYSPGG